MSTPWTFTERIAAYKAAGIKKIVIMKGAEQHNRDKATGKPFGPVHGLTIHHTAGVGPHMAQQCYDGVPGLPGPLCHDFLAKDGTLYIVGHGRTNHAGSVTPAVRDAIINENRPGTQRTIGTETVDGNDFLHGLEIENKGDGKDPYPAAQYDVAVRWAAAHLKHYGWFMNSAWGHKEITTRKIDPSFNMNTFRDDVDDFMHTVKLPASTTPTTPPRSVDHTPVPTTNGATPMALGLYTSVYKNDDTIVLGAGQTRDIYFTGEQNDDPGDHGLNGKTVLTDSQFTGAGKLKFAGVSPAGIRVQLVRQQNNATVGTEWMQDLPAGLEHASFPVAGTIPDGFDLVLQVVNNSTGTVTLAEAWLRLFSQAL